ncbi:MAG: hypothetical protein ACYTHM_21120 [Planctomycetota bacterium]
MGKSEDRLRILALVTVAIFGLAMGCGSAPAPQDEPEQQPAGKQGEKKAISSDSAKK